MKQKVTKKKKNSDFPVEFPPKNDGPIFHLLISDIRDPVGGGGGGRGGRGDMGRFIIGLKEAELLLSKFDKEKSDTDEDSDPIIEALATRLMFQLCTTTRSHQSTMLKPTLRQQLASLRTFKNEIQKAKEDIDLEVNENRNVSATIGIYRILCELCLCCDTPHSFKKAGYSCLSALMSFHLMKEDQAVNKVFNDMHVSVIESILYPIQQKRLWKEPIQTLFDAFTYDPMKDTILEQPEYVNALLRLSLSEGSQKSEILKNVNSTRLRGDNFNEEEQTRNGVVGLDVLDAVESSLEICSTLKAIFTPIIQMNIYLDHHDSTNIQEKLALYDEIIDSLIKPLMYCQATSTDALIVGGVCYSQILLMKWALESKDNESFRSTAYGFFLKMIGHDIENCDISFEDYMDSDSNNNMGSLNGMREKLPDIMVMKGLTSTLSDTILALPINEIKSQNDRQIFLIDRIASYMMALCHNSSNDAIRLWSLKGLDTIMGRCRGIILLSKSESKYDEFSKHVVALANDILHLSLIIFDSPPCKQIGSAIPGLFKSLVNLIEVLDDQSKSMDILVKQVLTQPPSRKGKYVALDALLYKIGATKLLEISQCIGSHDLVTSFIHEISERGNSAGAVAELLGKILSLLRNEMHLNAGVDLHRDGETKKERRKREKKIANGDERINIFNDDDDDDDIRLLSGWFEIWVPQFAEALIFSKTSRQSHISSYCLPLIMTMVGGTARKTDACHSFAALLDEISNMNTDHDKMIWAKLEVIRHASLNKLFRSSLPNSVLYRKISDAVSLEQLSDALVHDSPRIRVVAYQTASVVIPALNRELRESPSKSIEFEADLWKQSLPYAFNCTEREHMLHLNDALQNFLTRVADIESTSRSEVDGKSILSEFVEFLLGGLFLKQAYPGTISQKESLSLKMLDVVINFASETKLDKKTTQKNSVVRSNTRTSILSLLVSDDIFATLLSLLYSMWDATRVSAFATICKLISLANRYDLALPLFLSQKNSRDFLSSRAFHLASSPRQREADTGARLLAILCSTLPSVSDQHSYLKDLSLYLQERLKLMEDALGVVLNPEAMGVNENTPTSNSAFKLPLAHGLIQALQLIINDVIKVNEFSQHASTYFDLTRLFCRAIEVSLVVVADVDDDANESESAASATSSDKRWKAARGNKSGSTPLNVNTGALGANAFDDKDIEKKMIMQRILIGSWLLTKEACAALSSVVTVFPGRIDPNIISTAGDLLISTLTTLKHQGAAFAAHKALQSLSARCYKEADGNELRSFPSVWSQRLLDEISCSENVRDSTLRRSTGYGLGVLSILRTEPSSGPKFLFQNTLSSIIRYSLPSYSKMNEYMTKWHFSSSKNMLSYPLFLSPQTIEFVGDKEYECRTRIHAQNILRLVILDAPLALEMRKFVGDSIISALIGYTDTSWAIRNSATMTFTAAMLRVVDADKNAEAKMKGSKNVSGINAISASELFRSYPPLAPILLAIIKEECGGPRSNNAIHPVLFPLLLLLSRLQPISMSQVDPSTDEISKMFIDPVISCLGHEHHKVRVVAARALNILCSDDDDDDDDDDANRKSFSRRNLILKCAGLLSENSSGENTYNKDHGLLMALKCLIEGSTHPHQYFKTYVKNVLVQFASWGCFKATCPPSCAAIALEVWCCIHKSFDNDMELSKITLESQGTTYTILDVVFKIIECIESIHASYSTSIVGLATLASTAAKVAVELLYPHISSSTSKSTQSVHFWKLSQRLLCSDVFDVMLHSVKSFKKKMWLLLEPDAHSLPGTLHGVCGMFMETLLTIIRRDGISAHPPTLRRITRCILETVARYRSLSDDHNISQFGQFGVGTLHEMFTQFCRMLILDTKSNSIGTNVGNVLELISLTIPELCESIDAEEHKPLDFQSGLDLFFDQVFKLSDAQNENWKLRLSAAISIRESKLLENKSNKTSIFVQMVKKYKVRLLFRTVQLLQDSDEDVRRAAAATLLRSDLRLSSLRRLEKGYELLTKTFSNDRYVFAMLTNQIATLLGDLIPTASDIVEEYNCSIVSINLSEVQNLNSKRKIFEEEDISAFEESLLVIHISIKKLIEISLTFDDTFEEYKGLYQGLNGKCLEMMSLFGPILQRMKGHPDISHNFFWNSKLFGKIQSILLVATFSVYQFGGADLVESAKKFESLTNFTHPCIAEAITVLSHAKHNDDLTRERLIKCCFLVPNMDM